MRSMSRASVVRRILFLPVLLSGPVLSSGCGPGSDGDASDQAESARGGEDWFREEASARGVDFVLSTGMSEQPWAPEIIVGGGAALDFDDDGLLDLYLLQSSGAGGNRLFRNLGDGRFEDVTESSNTGHEGYGSGVATGDYDGDGDVDLFVTNLGPDVLLRNEGDGSFRDVTVEAGLGDDGWGASAGFLDIDDDGDLDLYVTRYLDWSPEREKPCLSADGLPDYCHPESFAAESADLLYRNEGDGRFTDISESSGISSVRGNGLGVAAADFDGDGRVDVFVANDKNPDRLWRNLGGGRFEEAAFRMGCDRDLTAIPKAGMGVSVEDVDDDGDPDLIVCNVEGETDSFYVNEGGRFVDTTNPAGIGSPSRRYTRFGLGFVDFDNDGVLDYFAANGAVTANVAAAAGTDRYVQDDLLMRGLPGRLRFEEVAPPGGVTGLPPATSRGAIFGDFDNDGGMDIGVVNRDAGFRLLMNAVPDRGRWAIFDVRDDRGAPAIGAMVRVDIGVRTLTRFVRSDASYMTANDARVHVGLGDLERIPRVTVRWRDGREMELAGLEADSIHRIEPED